MGQKATGRTLLVTHDSQLITRNAYPTKPNIRFDDQCLPFTFLGMEKIFFLEGWAD